jgi:hypothetical protein
VLASAYLGAVCSCTSSCRFGVRLEEADDAGEDHVNAIGERARGVEEVPVRTPWEHEALGHRFKAPLQKVLVPQRDPTLTLLALPAPAHLPETTVIVMPWASTNIDATDLVSAAERALGFIRGGGIADAPGDSPVLFYAPTSLSTQGLENALASTALVAGTVLDNWGVLRTELRPPGLLADSTTSLRARGVLSWCDVERPDVAAVLTLLEAFPGSTYLLPPPLALEIATRACESADVLAALAGVAGQGATFLIAPETKLEEEQGACLAGARKVLDRLPSLLRDRLFHLP